MNAPKPALLVRLNSAYYALWQTTQKALLDIISTPAGLDMLARLVYWNYSLKTGRRRAVAEVKAGWFRIQTDWRAHRDEFAEFTINVDSSSGRHFQVALPVAVVFDKKTRATWIAKMAEGQAAEHEKRLAARRAYFVAEAKKIGLKTVEQKGGAK